MELFLLKQSIVTAYYYHYAGMSHLCSTTLISKRDHILSNQTRDVRSACESPTSSRFFPFPRPMMPEKVSLKARSLLFCLPISSCGVSSSPTAPSCVCARLRLWSSLRFWKCSPKGCSGSETGMVCRRVFVECRDERLRRRLARTEREAP